MLQDLEQAAHHLHRLGDSVEIVLPSATQEQIEEIASIAGAEVQRDSSCAGLVGTYDVAKVMLSGVEVRAFGPMRGVPAPVPSAPADDSDIQFLMPLVVHTSRLPHYHGTDALDISRKGMDPIGVRLAPSWELLRRYLPKFTGEPLTEEKWLAYCDEYTVEMRTSYSLHRDVWHKLITERRRVVLLCWCVDGTHCHRSLATPKLAAVGRRLGVEVIDGGELDDEQVAADNAAAPQPQPFTDAEVQQLVLAPIAEIVAPTTAGPRMIIHDVDAKCRPFTVIGADGKRAGGGFLCGGRRARRRCKGDPNCDGYEEYLCDWPLSGEKAGRTCDRPLCSKHAHLVAANTHYCPAHKALQAMRTTMELDT